MFGGSNLFQALSDDFMRDPFFQDPFRSAFSEAGFLEPSHVLTRFPASTVPQRRGREVGPPHYSRV